MYTNVPTLSDILFYTATDSYDYLTDNRPLYQLNTNINTIASSLVGIGYGEHTAINGGLLPQGKIVEFLPANGQIKFPDSSTVPATAILGIVIGMTSAGLNKVIWSSQILDLNALGLGNLIANSTAGQYIVANADGSGSFTLTTSLSNTSLVVGKIRIYPFITIDRNASSAGTLAFDSTAQLNHYNLYGFSRVRNLLLSISAGMTPVQYTKQLVYQKDISQSLASVNLMNMSLNLSTGQILAGTSGSVTYGLDSLNWLMKEKYSRFQTTQSTPSDNISDSTNDTSTWATNSYQTTLTNGLMNYELQPVNSGLDYTNAANTDTFKNFDIQTYYQYTQVSNTSPIYGKVAMKATVFDTHSIQEGGEIGTIMICDFFNYDAVTGLETSSNRIVLTGTIATVIYQDTSIFPTLIKSA